MYARALFQAAKDEGRLDAAHEELGDFVRSAVEVPELGALLRNPQLDPRAKTAALQDLLDGSDEIVRNFLLLLVEKGRTGELDEIARELDLLVAQEQRRLTVELTTAYELSDAEADAIVRQIEQASGRTVEATRRVDPDLVGGIVLRAGSLRVDASVRGRFERLRHELLSRV
jgi:F-type H+-transporting ATPase subunit delta